MRFPPFDTYGMDDDEVLLLKETCEALSNTYKTEFVNINHRKELSPAFKDIQENIAGVAIVENQFKICFLVFTKVLFEKSKLYMPNPHLRHNSFQVCAYAQLRKNFGNIFIRKKTLTDKMLDIFLSVTVSFKNYKNFNRKFYILADNKELAGIAINNDVIDLLMSISEEDFSINITNKKLIVQCPFTLNARRTIKLAQFASAMSVV